MIMWEEEEIVEDGRFLPVLVDVVPDGHPRNDAVTRGEEIAIEEAGDVRSGKLRLIQEPTGLHAPKLIVQHERSKAVGDMVVGKELEVILVELKRHRELVVDLQTYTCYLVDIVLLNIILDCTSTAVHCSAAHCSAAHLLIAQLLIAQGPWNQMSDAHSI